MTTIVDNERWVVFYSRTGQEIVDLAHRLNRIPDAIVTNIPQDEVRDEVLALQAPIFFLPDRPTAAQYEAAIGPDVDHTTVTLHGWLRIVPDEICKRYNIFNGHPGLITEHPELKGFNPQEKAFRLGHRRIGSVVHRAIAEVDEGEILAEVHIDLDEEQPTLDDYYEALRETSLSAWYLFLTPAWRDDA